MKSIEKVFAVEFYIYRACSSGLSRRRGPYMHVAMWESADYPSGKQPNLYHITRDIDISFPKLISTMASAKDKTHLGRDTPTPYQKPLVV